MSAEALLQFASFLQKSHWFAVATATAAFWDHISTFDLEVELIWKKKVSLVQVLYIVTSYAANGFFLQGLAAQIWITDDTQFNKSCNSYALIQFWLAGAAATAMQGLMMHRVLSMYEQRRRARMALLFALCILMLSEVTVTLVLSLGTSLTKSSIILAPTVRTCLPGNWPSWSSATWFISITYDIVVVAFTVWEGLRFLKESQKEMSALETDAPPGSYLKKTWSRQGVLFRVLIRDSILFPFIGTVSCLVTIVVWLTTPLEGLAFYSIQATSALTPILGCRLVLNLRNAYYQPFSEEMRMSMKGYDLDMLSNSVEYPLEVYTIRAQGMGSGDGQARTDRGAF
ncbi:hypothetical protein DFP72DRAFT_181200 [Ephemerocybe angulata]|uniref:DUF6533 domain-containing protein n=1 Tax=Ephemerocybe angulata TaxID=980116 RepID=A0A8H6LUD7_9AGAR|nr:hypothetical protein DFP72DRAFT_181200 [Tulosesus angulatus]